MGGVQGQASDIDIQAKEILRLRERLNEIMVKHTSQTMRKIKRDTDRDHFMESEDAVKYGIIDSVIENRKWLHWVSPIGGFNRNKGRQHICQVEKAEDKIVD